MIYKESSYAENPFAVWYVVSKRVSLGTRRRQSVLPDAKQTIYIKDVLSHKEYDKEKWKGGCGQKSG